MPSRENGEKKPERSRSAQLSVLAFVAAVTWLATPLRTTWTHGLVAPFVLWLVLVGIIALSNRA